MYEKLKSFFLQSVRVWRVLRKPSMQEFTAVSKVSSIGILGLGAIGFVISLVMKVF